MKKNLVILLALFQVFNFAQNKIGLIDVTVKNPSNFARLAETVEIPIVQVFNSDNRQKESGVVVYDSKGKVVCSQFIANYKEASDLIIFQSDFKPNETKRFKWKFTNSKDTCKTVTDGKFVLPREDYAWENDRIAFRMYGPALAKDVNNGIDVWTKRVPYPIVAKWYKESEGSAPGKDSYHIDKGEGADFFSVGRTLGAGSSSLFYKDSIYQPGVFSRYKTIATGPIRVIFELYYDSLIIDGVPVKETKRISLDANCSFNTITETYSVDTKKLPNNLSFVAGLVKRKNTTGYYNEAQNWFSLWGPVNDDPVNGFLGTALIVPAQYNPKMTEAPLQYLVHGSFPETKTYTYYAGGGWSRQGICSDENGWKQQIEYFSKCKQQPLKISAGRK